MCCDNFDSPCQKTLLINGAQFNFTSEGTELPRESLGHVLQETGRTSSVSCPRGLFVAKLFN